MMFGRRFGGPLFPRLAGFCSSWKAGQPLFEVRVCRACSSRCTSRLRDNSGKIRSQLGWVHWPSQVIYKFHRPMLMETRQFAAKERGGNLRGHFRLQPANGQSLPVSAWPSHPLGSTGSRHRAGLGLRTSELPPSEAKNPLSVHRPTIAIPPYTRLSCRLMPFDTGFNEQKVVGIRRGNRQHRSD